MGMNSALESFLAHQVVALDLLTGSLPARAFEDGPVGKWNARQHVAHLGRYNELFLARVQRIAADEKPHFGRYIPEEDEGFAAWLELDLPAVQTRYQVSRSGIEQSLRELPDGAWQQTGTHGAFGEMSLAQWVAFFLVHEGHHFYQAMRLARMSPGA